jgi:hypothetical protein
MAVWLEGGKKQNKTIGEMQQKIDSSDLSGICGN